MAEDKYFSLEKEFKTIQDDILAKCSKTNVLYVVIDYINGMCVNGIFTSHQKASEYIIKSSIWFINERYGDPQVFEDCKGKAPSNEDLIKEVKAFTAFYEIKIATFLNPSQPIYLLQSGNFRVYGKPEEYLTNSLENATRYYRNNEWYISSSIVQINPSAYS